MRRLVRVKHERKPRKLTLSPTKISAYLTCRLMFKFTYIDRISRFFYRPKSFHTFGASLHRALDEFHSNGGAQTQSADQLVETVHAVWTSTGYASPEDEMEHLAAAEQFVQRYHTEHAIEGAKTLFTEKQLKVDMGEFALIGRIDRMDEHADGCLEIVDYKSGRSAVSTEDVQSDLAMGIYSLLARRLYPDRQVLATIYALRTGDKATVQHSDEELAELEGTVRVVAAEIAQIDSDTVIDPTWTHECPHCDYLRVCAKRAGWDRRE